MKKVLSIKKKMRGSVYERDNLGKMMERKKRIGLRNSQPTEAKGHSDNEMMKKEIQERWTGKTKRLGVTYDECCRWIS